MEKELELLKQDIKNHKEVSDEKLSKIDDTLKELDERIKTMEMSKQKTEFQYQQIMKTLEKLNDITTPNLTKQIQELKNKPAERYNLIVTSIISAIVGGIVTFFINSVLKS